MRIVISWLVSLFAFLATALLAYPAHWLSKSTIRFSLFLHFESLRIGGKNAELTLARNLAASRGANV